MTTHTTFKQVDVKRVVKAVVDAGLPVERVEITREGTISVLTNPEQRVEIRPEPDL